MDLCLAAQEGNEDAVRNLLSVNSAELSSKYLNDALILAVDGRQDTIAQLLVQKGAPFDIRPNARHNMLYRAVRLRCLNTFKAMLDRDVCELSARGENQWTLLHMLIDYFSSCFGDSKYALTVIDALLTKNVDINSQDKRGCTPLMMLMKSSSLPLLPRELLIRKADPNIRDIYGLSALHRACAYEHLNAQKIKIKDLIEFGANIDITDLNGSTPLHLADPNIIPTLLEYYPDLFIKDIDGVSSLHRAIVSTVSSNNVNSAKALYFHLKKLEACGLIPYQFCEECYINLESLPIFDTSLDVALAKCCGEVILLQQSCIEEDFNLQKFITASPHHLIPYIESIDQFFTTTWKNVRTDFTQYFDLIERKFNTFERVKWRHFLVSEGISIFTKIEPILPILVIEYILNFLNNDELQALSDAKNH